MLKFAVPLPSAFLLPRPPAAAVNHLRHSTSFHHRRTTSHTIPRTTALRAKLDGSSYGEKPDPVEMGSGAFFDSIMGGGGIDDEYDYDDEDEEETESSIDLFIRFLQSSLKKVSRRAKRASRSVLPTALSPQLISFAVDGVLILAVLFVLKSLLQVFCTLGSTIFAAILIVRVVWAAVSYFQSGGDDGRRRSSGTRQPVG